MSGEKDVPEKIHAELGASSASRWMACPGSVRLSALMPTPLSSPAAVEGTRAHALAELCLTKGIDPDTYVGLTLEGGEVTDDMAEDVLTYIAFARQLIEESTKHWIEHRFNLAALKPVRPLYGTADLVTYDGPTKTLHVADLKFGRGVLVEVEDNPQLKYYGLGAALTLTGLEIETIVTTIVQPRAGHADGPIRSHTYPYTEIIEFAGELLRAAEATVAPDAPLVPGKQCRWCRAAGSCPAQRMAVEAAAQMSFDAYVQPVAPETLSDEELAKVMAILPMVNEWTAAVHRVVEGKLARGEGFPGFKLVSKRPTRQWLDKADVEAWLKAQDYNAEEIFVQKIKSPAQVEKLVGKKNLPSEFVTKVSSGYAMVPESDHRPALAALAQEEFTALLPAPAIEDE